LFDGIIEVGQARLDSLSCFIHIIHESAELSLLLHPVAAA
jgi:hypothetical protein